MGQPTGLDLYPYNPSTAATAIFAVLYGLLAIYHSYLCFIYSRSVSYKHRYTIPLVVAACFSTAGYATRAASIKSPGNISLYAISSSWIVISPIFVCASLYLLVAHLIRRCLPAEHQSFFKVSSRWIGRLFITSDVLSFLTQASGSGVAASGNWQGNLKIVGTDVLLVGLALQLATFTFFLLVTWRFVCRVRALNTIEFDIATKRVLKGVWIASAFVEIRSIYRVIEFSLGIYGYPFQHEWPLYVLEATPIFFALGALSWYHPVKWLQQKPITHVAAQMEEGTSEK